MVKRLLFFTVALLFFQVSEVFSQITIDAVDPGPYTPGSSIAVTFSLGPDCIRPGSVFELYLSDANGSFTSEVKVGEFNSFYSTFVNGTIPLNTVGGLGYKVRVKSTNPVLISTESGAFEIKTGAPLTAQVRSSPTIGPDMFGFCPGRDGQVFNFTNESTPASTVTGTIRNELTGTNSANLTFTPPTQLQSFTASLAHYTIFIKAEMPDGNVATKAYMLVNNNVFNSFSTSGSNVVCLPGGFLQYGVDVSSAGILYNYPGNTYQIVWGDNITDAYTFCDLKSGFVRHEYLTSSCGNPPYSTGGQTIYNVFGINISVVSPCGPVGGELSTYVRVVTKPENRFTSPVAACTNSLVTFTNNSIAGQDPASNTPECADNNVSYNWYVNNVLMLANVPRTTNFTHTFATHGVYDIKLESVTNGVCEGPPIVKQICIQDLPQPIFDFGGAAQTHCAPYSIQAVNRSIIDNLCNTDNTYNWIVTPSTGVSFTNGPQPTFNFTAPGIYQVQLQINTASCGTVTTEPPQTLIIIDSTPDITLSPDAILCSLGTFNFDNLTTGPTNTQFSGTQVDAANTYTWSVTESNGDTMPLTDYSFENGTGINTKYPSIKFNAFKTYKISVTHRNSCGEITRSQLITFSPSPVPDIVVNANPICYDAVVNLQGNITNGTYSSLTWISSGTGTFSAPNSLITTYTPSLAERNAGTTNIRLLVNTGLLGSCAQVEDIVTVNIRPNNTGINATQEICSGIAVSHTPASTISGSTYSWTVSNADGNASGYNPGSGTSITDVITNNNATTNAVVIYTITPLSDGCTGVPYTFTVTITPRPISTAVPNSPTICSDEAASILLTSNLPNTRYTWTTEATGGITGNIDVSTPTAVTTINDRLINNGTAQGSVTYTITPYSATGCPGTPVPVTVLVDPAVTVSNAGTNTSICDIGAYTLGGNPPKSNETGTWVWVPSTGQSGITISDENLPNAIANGLVAGQDYVFTWTISAPGVCSSSSSSVTITVNIPTVAGTLDGATTVCEAFNSGNINLTGNVGSVVQWESSIDGISWQPIAVTGTTLTYTNLTATTQYRAVVQNGSCEAKATDAITITVTPATTIANAGVDQVLCNQQGTTLDADPTLKPGETGLWTAIPSATIPDPTNPKATVTGLAVGQTYVFKWTISGNSPCGSTVSEVTIRNNAPINQSINSNSAVVCNGQLVTIDGTVPTGGEEGQYTYLWESKTGTDPWETIPGETGEDLNITLTTTGDISFRRVVNSGGCTSTSNELPIIVQPPIANNTISADQTICSGITPVLLTGSQPTGADGTGVFIYQWQSSIDENTWVNIDGANVKDYQPPILTATTFYRRIASTIACSGSLQSISLPVKITVNPNAEAVFTYLETVGCAPFTLNITATPFPDRNATYTWYADDVIIGSGITFPGYTISTSNSSITIKLVTTSLLGCSSDEMSHVFSTNQAVPASYTQSVTSGCGPLAVNFVNTSILTAGATFAWDFGNGTTSNATNPGPVTFQPEPTGRDTTYTVTLTATTSCGTNSINSTVFVKAKPVAILSPSKTDGCSPMLVRFKNTSPGSTNTYIYDFGDGSPVVTKTDTSFVQHTYNTIATQTFYATLTVVNECGTDTKGYNIVVAPQNITPLLVVDGTQKQGCAPLTVNFDNNSIGASRFTFDFGDGGTLNTITTGRVQHIYTRPGTFTVTMTAYNSCSEIAATESITVLPQPLAAFEADNTLGCTGLSVKFRNTTQDGFSYLWDFGDGTTSDEFEPTHVYTGDQEYYTVTLTATNTLGCSISVSRNQYIHIVQPPVALFNVNPSTLISIPNYTFNFQDESTNSPTIWEWDFGDGTQSSMQSPSHTYPDTGTYRVNLKVMNQQGCFTTTFKDVTIKGVPGYLFVPNSFIPGSPLPELRVFSAKGSGIQSWKFSIFNKWGELLWETTKLEEGRPAEGWDGTFKGSPLPQGVYYWKIDVQMVNGSEWKGMTYDNAAPKRTGPIHLIR